MAVLTASYRANRMQIYGLLYPHLPVHAYDGDNRTCAFESFPGRSSVVCRSQKMNNIKAVGPKPFLCDDYSTGSNEFHAEENDWRVTLDRLLVLASIAIVGVFLANVLHPNHFMLTACFAWAGLWATAKLSEEGSYFVAPILVFLNLVCWTESFIALPIAALTIGLSQEFPVDESMREALRLSGLTGAAITLLLMLVG